MEKTRTNPKTPFVVKIDPLLLPLIPEYLRNRHADLQRLAEALERKDFAFLRKLGHDLYGSGGGYGLPPISEVGREIEQAALAGDASRIEAAAVHLREFLEAVKLPP